MALKGGLIKEAKSCLQWFLFFCSMASGLDEPLLAGSCLFWIQTTAVLNLVFKWLTIILLTPTQFFL